MVDNDYIPDGAKSYIPEEVKKLYELGAAGKLWTISIQFALDGETKMNIHRNLRRNEVMNLRGSIFQYGFLHPVGDGHWLIIPPMDIQKVYLDRQSGYFSG